MKPNSNIGIDEYIGTFPTGTQKLLHQLRATIRETAPEAEEVISYQMPAFKLNEMLVYFAGHKNHIGFYPTASGISAFKDELSDFKSSKGSVQFPLDKPLPLALIRKIVQFRIHENLHKTQIRMINSAEIKSIVLGIGADKCGIASIDRFSSAPEGFRPTDVYSKCKSVLVFLKRMPPKVILAENPVPYSHTAYLLYAALDQIGLKLCSELGKHGIQVIPVPTDVPYLHWDAGNKHGMGIISMRHAAFNAGLGILGRNTLLINREYGNMVYIGAVLLETEVEPDTVVTDFACPPNCRLCIEACPVQALDGVTVNQKKCREYSTLEHPRGWDIYSCSECRKVCLYRNGTK